MERVVTYDGLRGWLLVIIACNHLWGNFVSNFTRPPLGYVSAAEAFVFLSGYVAYFVYRNWDDNPHIQTKRILYRVVTIYLFHISAIAITFLMVCIFPLYQNMWSDFFLAGNFFIDKGQFFLASALLLEHPGYHDILVMYLFAMLLLPFAMFALRKNLWFIVLLTSVVIWLLAPVINFNFISPIYQLLFPDLLPQLSYFDPMAWQLYFYLGVLLSFVQKTKSINLAFNLFTKVVVLGFALLFMISKQFGTPDLTSYTANSGIAQFGIVINLLLLAYCFMLWMRHFPKVFILKYPVFLGQHALPVFSFHTIIVYFLVPIAQPYITHFWYWDVACCLLFVILLAIPAKLDQLYRQWKSKVKLAKLAAIT